MLTLDWTPLFNTMTIFNTMTNTPIALSFGAHCETLFTPLNSAVTPFSRDRNSLLFSLSNLYFLHFLLPYLQLLTSCIMSPSKESSLFVLVEPHGAIAQAICEYPENVKYRRYGRARADFAVGNHNQDGLDLSAQAVDPETFANADLVLSLNPGPKDLSKGFVFGSDPQTCDVLLAKDKTSGISGNHFSINVDWRSGNPLITCLTPDDGTGIHILSLSESLWKLYLRAASKEIEPNTTITVRVSRRIKLVIHNPSRDRNEYGYNKNLQDYLKRSQNAIPDMRNMRLYDPEQTPLMISRTRGLTGREYVTTTSSVGGKIVHCEARGHQNWAGDSQTFIVKRYRYTSNRWNKHARDKLNMLCALRQVSDFERMLILNFIADFL